MENPIRKAANAEIPPLSKEAIRDRVTGMMNVSTIPAVLNRIIELTGNPNTVNHELAQVIERDQAIAMRVVAASNSSFYGFSKKISTISQAILVLGFDMVRGLAITTSVFNTVPAKHRGSLKELWGHSFAAAQAAALLAKKTGAVEQDVAFLAGLFHDIGRAVMLQICESGCNELNPFDRNPVDKEERVFGATHAEIGSWLAERFNLPENCVRAIRHHHDPENCSGNPLVAITYLANLAASGGPNSVASPAHAGIVASLGLSQETLDELAEEIGSLKDSSTSYYD